MNKINSTQQVLQAWKKASQLERPPEPPQLAFYLPATPPMGLIRALDRGWWRCQRRWLFRRHILPLVAYGKHLEQALGYRGEDILWASKLPLKVDAIQALEARRA